MVAGAQAACRSRRRNSRTGRSREVPLDQWAALPAPHVETCAVSVNTVVDFFSRKRPPSAQCFLGKNVVLEENVRWAGFPKTLNPITPKSLNSKHPKP